MNNRILLFRSNLNSQFGNTLLTTQQQGRGELELESQRAVWYMVLWKKRKPGKSHRKATRKPGKLKLESQESMMIIHSITIK